MAKRQKKPKSGAPAWMASFADLQQLLLVFFILLFSMSSVDEQKFNSAMSSIQDALNTNGLGLTDKGVIPNISIIDLDQLKSLTELKEFQIEQELLETQEFLNSTEFSGQTLSSYVSASKGEEGVVLTIKDVMLFDSGSADLKNTSKALIEKLSPLLSSKDRNIRVEGHTDNVPLKNTSKYEDNWELSTARATRVASFIMDNNIVVPSKIAVAGYSEYKPVAENNSSANRAKNRRVDIVLLSDFSEVEKKYEDKKNKENKETKNSEDTKTKK